MPEYTPLVPSGPFTSTTSAAVTGGKCLIASGNDTVAQSGGASAAFVGVAAFDAASGEKVTVLRGGVHSLDASGSIAAGDLVTTAASGAVAAQGTPSAANAVQVIGVALSAAASDKVKVLLFR